MQTCTNKQNGQSWKSRITQANNKATTDNLFDGNKNKFSFTFHKDNEKVNSDVFNV